MTVSIETQDQVHKLPDLGADKLSQPVLWLFCSHFVHLWDTGTVIFNNSLLMLLSVIRVIYSFTFCSLFFMHDFMQQKMSAVILCAFCTGIFSLKLLSSEGSNEITRSMNNIWKAPTYSVWAMLTSPKFPWRFGLVLLYNSATL